MVEEILEADAYHGICPVCGFEGLFKRENHRTRETYPCGGCRSSLRYRAQANAILQLFGQGRARTLQDLMLLPSFQKLKVYEPGVAGPFRKIFRKLENYTQSFYWPDVPPGELRDGIICQDLHRITFKAESFDLVITSDIFEHVRHPYLAFSEIRRVLKFGGVHVFSIPVSAHMPSKSASRVDTSTEEDVHILPPVYHGSGVAGGKSLVYTNFGRDIFVQLAESGFPTGASLYAPEGSAIPPQITFVSTRL